MTVFYHGTTKRIALKIFSERRFLESRNEYDWLGPGVYFYQECPEKALFWAEEFSIKEKFSNEMPAVIEVDVSLAKTLDLAGSKALATLQTFAKTQKKISIAQSNPILRTIDNVRKKIFSGTVINHNKFVGYNKDDYNLVLDLIAYLNEEDAVSFDSVRAVFWEGMEIRKGSYFFDHANIQLCIFGKILDKDNRQERYVDFASMPLQSQPRLLSDDELNETKHFKDKIRHPI